MVRINFRNFNKIQITNSRIHGFANKAEYDILTKKNGDKTVKILQINTYGSANRKNPGIQSQTIQLDEDVVKLLYDKMFNSKNIINIVKSDS